METSPTASDVLEPAFSNGDYTFVIERLSPQPQRTIREEAMLGMALLRTGQFGASEIPLLTALGRGSLEASVEYGNLLRATGENRRAIAHFEALMPNLTGELKFRALRWMGVARYGLSDPQGTLDIEAARIGYLSLGDVTTAARISHTLSALYSALGDFRKSRKLLDEALPKLKEDPNPRPLLSAYNTLIDLQLEAGLTDDAADTLELASSIAAQLKDEHTLLKLEARRILLMLKAGDYGAFVQRLKGLQQEAERLQDNSVYVFASNSLANHLSRTGQHAAALRVMATLNHKVREPSLETVAVSAMLTLRRGDAVNALGQMVEIRSRAEKMGAYFDATRASLLSALCCYRLQDYVAALNHLTIALSEMAGWPSGQVRAMMENELKDAEDLLAYAKMTPDLLPVINAALEETLILAGANKDDLFSEQSRLELQILGRQPQVLLNGIPITMKLPYTVGILTYLALEPERNRNEITADLWGDQDPVRAASSFRQAMVEIRRVLGPDIVVMSGSHQSPRYAISPKVTVQLDSQRVLHLAARGDVPAAVSAYRGQFLERLPSSEWLELHRHSLQGTLISALKVELRQASLNGEPRRVVVLASAILDIDPDDFEVEELRLEAAKQATMMVEYARFEALKKQRLN